MKNKMRWIPLIAAVMVIAAGMTAFAEGWVQAGTTWNYLDENGNKVCNEWKKGVDDKWRWLDSSGNMAMNKWVDDTYYVDGEGIMAAGVWLKLTNGLNEYWYYFQSTGRKCEGGWNTINNNRYYFDYDGHMMTGWVDDDNYYCGSDGRPVTGWQYLDDPDNGSWGNGDTDGKHWYYFQTESGKKYTPVLSDDSEYVVKTIDDVKYCLNGNGAMQTGWINVNGTSDTDEESISDYKYFQKNGAMATGWLAVAPPERFEGNYEYGIMYFYFNNSGIPQAKRDNLGFYTTSDIRLINGKRYIFDRFGAVVCGMQQIFTSAAKTDYDTYYLGNAAQSCVQTGKVTVSSGGVPVNYYFSSTGRGYTGATGGYLYYKGRLQKAESSMKYQAFIVSGCKYLVNTEGKIMKNRKKLKDGDKAVWYTDSKGVVTSYEGSTTNIPADRPEEPEYD